MVNPKYDWMDEVIEKLAEQFEKGKQVAQIINRALTPEEAWVFHCKLNERLGLGLIQDGAYPKDKNGREIRAGDTIRAKSTTGAEGEFKVYWDNGALCFNGKPFLNYMDNPEIEFEVIEK